MSSEEENSLNDQTRELLGSFLITFGQIKLSFVNDFVCMWINQTRIFDKECSPEYLIFDFSETEINEDSLYTCLRCSE